MKIKNMRKHAPESQTQEEHLRKTRVIQGTLDPFKGPCTESLGTLTPLEKIAASMLTKKIASEQNKTYAGGGQTMLWPFPQICVKEARPATFAISRDMLVCVPGPIRNLGPPSPDLAMQLYLGNQSALCTSLHCTSYCQPGIWT